MNINDIPDGTKVTHESWSYVSEPMTVKRKNNKIFLAFEDEEDTEYNAGGETDDGWMIEE